MVPEGTVIPEQKSWQPTPFLEKKWGKKYVLKRAMMPSFAYVLTFC